MNFIIVGLGIAVLYLVTSSNLVAGEINMTTPGYKKFGDAWVKYDSTFRATANFYGVPFKWLKAIAIIESALGTNERVKRGEVSYDGKSYGFMQFRLSTAQDFDKSATVDKLNQAEYSIDLAGQYLSYLSKM
jgi:soluble lytic murein transglycosylase-like protein